MLRISFILGMISLIILAITGFAPMILDSHLHGYMLMAHMTFVPVFVICFVALVILTANRMSRWGFLLLLALFLVMSLSMALSMFPLFSTSQQQCLLEVHRWSAMAFSLMAVIELIMLKKQSRL